MKKERRITSAFGEVIFYFIFLGGNPLNVGYFLKSVKCRFNVEEIPKFDGALRSLAGSETLAEWL